VTAQSARSSPDRQKNNCRSQVPILQVSPFEWVEKDILCYCITATPGTSYIVIKVVGLNDCGGTSEVAIFSPISLSAEVNERISCVQESPMDDIIVLILHLRALENSLGVASPLAVDFLVSPHYYSTYVVAIDFYSAPQPILCFLLTHTSFSTPSPSPSPGLTCTSQTFNL
jgi:hypothetical protein